MDGLTISTQGFDAQGLKTGRSDSLTRPNSLPRANTESASGASFADTLKGAIQNVNQLQQTADTQVQKLATGESQNLHETMIAVEKADIALRLMVQVRNKIIDAYQEIMKMQV